ncbi:asparagine synthase (glutamine-hydrolyzing) [Bradyrhizobium sp. USDA 326]
MCGIAGIYSSDRRLACEGSVRAMVAALHHRGPDDSSILIAPGVALGHARLAIRDLSIDGRQPFTDPSGRIIVSYNGEIYNDREIRTELARDFGFTFRTSCDTEIIPLGYLAWGDRIFDRLEGMFAVALWDRDERRLILARDGIGIKPLYYAEDRGVVRFASEIKGIFADPAQPRQASAAGLHAFFAMGYVGPQDTTFEGVHQIAPGTVVTYCEGKRTERRFWRPTRTAEITSIDDATVELEQLWSKVVSDQLVSDVPVGVLLSGGIDSTLVALGADRSDGRLPMFTASFANQDFDETPLARMVADTIGAKLRSVQVEMRTDLDDLLATVVHHYDGQSCDEASLALLLLSQEVRKNVTVALTGDGGDEFFAGYPTYTASKWAARLGPLLPSGAWNQIGQFFYGFGGAGQKRLPLSAIAFRFAFGMAAGPNEAHACWRRYVPQFMLSKLYGSALRPLLGEDPFRGYKAEIANAEGDLIDRCLVADQRWHLPAGLLLKSDAMSMAHSLELRVPFLDRRIMDFAGRCHADLLLSRQGEKKALLRRLARRLKAPSAVTEGAKHGFNAPLAGLLRHELRSTAERIFEREADALAPFIVADEARLLWREHAEHRRDHSYAIWPILHFGISRTLSRSVVSTPAASADLKMLDFGT